MNNIKILVARNPLYSACPSCGKSGTLKRSRSKSMTEQIIGKIGIVKIFRCGECGWRGMKTSLALTHNSYKSLLIYIVLIVTTAVLARYVITHFIIV